MRYCFHSFCGAPSDEYLIHRKVHSARNGPLLQRKACMRTGTSPMNAFCGQLPSDEWDAAARDIFHVPMNICVWACMRTGTSPHALSRSDEYPIHRKVHSSMNGPLLKELTCMRTGTSPHASPILFLADIPFAVNGRCFEKSTKCIPSLFSFLLHFTLAVILVSTKPKQNCRFPCR